MSNFPSKFRLYDREQDRVFTSTSTFFVSGYGKLYVENHNGFQEADEFRYDVMWFIGVTDKENKEVYTGDIVKRESTPVDGEVALPDYEGALGVVNFNGHRFTVDQRTGHKWAFYGPEGINFSWDHDLRVVGNIYENKELLTD